MSAAGSLRYLAIAVLAMTVCGCGGGLFSRGAGDNLTTGSIASLPQDDFVPNEDMRGGGGLVPPPPEVAIGNDTGGVVTEYALQRARWREAGTKVRFEGRCASACTLFLALPPEDLCVTTNAVFLFHAPTSPDRSARASAKAYLAYSYPDWVVAWIEDHGGLSANFLRMDYRFASRHLPTCAEGVKGERTAWDGNAASPALVYPPNLSSKA